MASFEENYKKVLASEGGYHSGIIGGKVDKGGETYRGIARKYHPTWDGWATIDAIKKVKTIPFNSHIPEVNQSAYNYSKKIFWDAYGLTLVDSQWVANMMFEIVWGFPSKATQIKTTLGIKSTTKWSDFARLINKLNPNNVYPKLRNLYASFLRNSSEYAKFKTGYENRIASWPTEIPKGFKSFFPINILAGDGEQKTDTNLINLFIFITSLFLV